MKRKLIPGLLAGGAIVAPTLAGAGHVRSGSTLPGASVGIAARSPIGATGRASPGAIESEARAAAIVFGSFVGKLSDPSALETAFRSYYAFKATRPDLVHRPLLYFVDYGLPADQARGYVFDMQSLRLVEGPFMVAHGRGSTADAHGVPTRFSNRRRSQASSLGLFLARETYAFRGRAGGRSYRSIGLRLEGLSGRINDNALDRRVVAHGAPYVTAKRAGRSEGCPAMEPQRAERLLPQLANGGLVFLFSPRADLLKNEQWAARSVDSA